MEPSTSSDVTLPNYEQAKVHFLSTASAKPEVPGAPPEEPSTSLDFPLPTYEQARVHSLSIASAKPEVPSAPPEYEEVDTTISGRKVQTTQSFLNQNKLDTFHDQTTYKIQTTLSEPSTTIVKQPTPIPCASGCNVSCRHSHNDICRRCKQKEDEETAELCINLCACIFGICALALSSSKS